MSGFPLGPVVFRGKYDLATMVSPTTSEPELGYTDPEEDLFFGTTTDEPPESSIVEELPPGGMMGTGPGDEPDPAAGGSTVQDPVEAAKASSDKVNSDSPYDEQMTVTANRSFPQIRGFTDRTFLLMHMHNLINIRNDTILHRW